METKKTAAEKKSMTNQLRDESGQYGHGLNAMCRCGRTKGAHDAVRPFPFGDYDGGPSCLGFKKARAKIIPLPPLTPRSS